MTAVIHPSASAAATSEFTQLTEAELPETQLTPTLSLGDELEEFLRDPIGHGGYNFDDPITLSEFVNTRHYHGLYATVLSR